PTRKIVRNTQSIHPATKGPCGEVSTWPPSGEYPCVIYIPVSSGWVLVQQRDSMPELFRQLNRIIGEGDGNALLAEMHRSTWNGDNRSEEHTSELQSRFDLVCRLLLE